MIEVLPSTIDMTGLAKVLQQYGCNGEDFTVENLGGGLINSTWKVRFGDTELVLQKVNTNVFTNPASIAFNIETINAYLKQHFPGYYFPAPVLNANGDTFYKDENGSWYRAFQFLKGSQTIDVVANCDQAYEAAKEFGRFSALLNNFPSHTLHENIPGFHNLTKRYNDFLQVLKTGDTVRLQEAKVLVETALSYIDIVKRYEAIVAEGLIKKRVTHHDTKISNVLFNLAGKAFAVIDLDTIMEGYYISDVGDMMRTYLSEIGEEDKNFDEVPVRKDVYTAIKDGYMSEMATHLTSTEKSYFYYSGQFLIFMQAIRFLTDYLSGDKYYTPAYPKHNFKRAQHQFALLKSYMNIASTQQ